MSSETATHLVSHPGGDAQVKRIWKTFWILLILTIAELSLGLSVYTIHKGPNPIFMHLGDEIRNLIMTIAVPATLFIWFIIAFLYDGNAWKHLRNTDAGSHPSTEHVQKQLVPAAMEKGQKN